MLTGLKVLAWLPFSGREHDELNALARQNEGQVGYERLPLFASSPMGYFDAFNPDREEGRFLLGVLQYLE